MEVYQKRRELNEFYLRAVTHFDLPRCRYIYIHIYVDNEDSCLNTSSCNLEFHIHCWLVITHEENVLPWLVIALCV